MAVGTEPLTGLAPALVTVRCTEGVLLSVLSAGTAPAVLRCSGIDALTAGAAETTAAAGKADVAEAHVAAAGKADVAAAVGQIGVAAAAVGEIGATAAVGEAGVATGASPNSTSRTTAVPHAS